MEGKNSGNANAIAGELLKRQHMLSTKKEGAAARANAAGIGVEGKETLAQKRGRECGLLELVFLQGEVATQSHTNRGSECWSCGMKATEFVPAVNEAAAASSI